MSKELNSKLLKSCTSDIFDVAEIELLLKQGANPLAAFEDSSGYSENLYELVVEDCFDNGDHRYRLPMITELFLRYGMDISIPELPYDDDNINPLWSFAFYDGTGSFMQALKMLLDAGLSAADANECWGHDFFDWYNVNDGVDDLFAREMMKESIKKLLLIASYPHVLNNDEELQEMICLSDNDYDVTQFRDYAYFAVDLSAPIKERRIEGVVVSIYSVEDEDIVWKITL